MAIVVEDGTGVAGANSYIDVAYLDAYLTERGLTVTGTKENLLIRAMDYVESHRDAFKGQKTDPAQETQFPRSGMYIDRGDTEFASDAIPVDLKKAQAQAAYEVDNAELTPSTVVPEVIQETVGPLTTIYGLKYWDGPYFPKVNYWLDPLLRGGTGFGIELCRS